MTTLAPDVEGSVRSEGRVDESSFADALNAVNVLHAVAGDMRGEPTQAVDDAVFTTIEQVQLREDFGSEKPTVVVSGDDQEEGAGPEASSDHEKNVTFTELREPTDTIPAVASTGSLGSDVGAEAMFTTIKSPPMARTPTRAAGPGGARPSSAQKARMSSAERSTTEESAPSFKTVVAEAVRQHAVRELRRVILLLPLVLSMVGHREEHPLLWERWEVWFLRPLYLLVAARLFIGLVFKLLEVVGAYEMLPARATMLLNAFHGTPIITIVWLSMWPAVRLLPSPEGDAWKMLIRMPWRVGLNLLIGLGAGAYGLLQAGLSGGLSHLSSRHFEERVNQTVLSLRVVRIIFSEARNIAVRRQNKRRKANSRHNRDRDRRPSRPSNAMLSVTSGKSPGASPAMSANAGKPLPRGESTSDLTSEDGELFDTSIFDFREQYAVLVGAMGLGLLNTLAESRKKARKAFQLLLHGQLNDEQTSASAAAKAQSGANGNGPLSPPAFDDADVMLVRRSYIEHVCGEAAERKGGKLARMQVTAHVTSLFANKAVTEEEFVAAFERVYREQRLVRASIDSFDLLQDRIRAVATVAWALLFGVALVFIPDWGDADISDSVVVPIATSGFSVVYALGWLPYETVSGALYTIYIRPYDIGDRVIIGNPGSPMDTTHFIVTEIWLTYTRLVDAATGRSHIMMNHILRRLDVCNLNRSKAATYYLDVQVPASTSVVKIAELIDAVRTFILETSNEWSAANAAVDSAQYDQGMMVINFEMTSAHKAHEIGPWWQSRSKVILFIHEYMLNSGMEYIKPPQPLFSATPMGGNRRGGASTS